MAKSGNDSLFRHAFSFPEIARQLLTKWLPAEFHQWVDWSSLKMEKVSGITPELTERREDIVYQIHVKGKPVCFYILLEHQSVSDPLMPWRIFEYLQLVWRHHQGITKGPTLPFEVAR